ncbi:Fc receptor-like protein 5 [Anomalospiza imberbis]|uniref:Fc receptor-like protein 5 n=1 Tax=Anomalospiza imberbis TaxID=187417 RepID=UPI00358F9C3F
MAGKVALLLWAQTLGLAGTQTTQLLVEPPWSPAVLWDRVTLTCQGSGSVGATTWYKDGQRWGQEGRDHLTVSKRGIYTCERPGSGLSPPVRVLDDSLVLQVPARALLEGDTVTLRCRVWWNKLVIGMRFYHDKKYLRVSLRGTELSLLPLKIHHSGRYHCGGWVGSRVSPRWEESVPVTVTVHELLPVLVLKGPTELPKGSPLGLSCFSTPSTLWPRATLLHVFYRDRQVVGGPQGSPQLLVPAVGVSHSGNYSCEVRSEWGAVWKSSAQLRITVHIPVANATITPGPLAHQVRPGDPVTLHCTVQVGSAPVTFTWLHNGQEVARGPLLELEDIDVGHSGTYQCVATNQLGQDGHRVFQALSPELTLEVTPGSSWLTAQTLGLTGAQTTQLLVEPPWLPAVLWERVTLTCQGSGTAGATTWYKDGQRWGQQGHDRFTVTESGTYWCDRPSTGLSPPVRVTNDWLVLQVPAQALLEGDTVTLRCRGWQDNPVTRVQFFRDEKDLRQFLKGTQLTLSPLQLNHSGRYRCKGWHLQSHFPADSESQSSPPLSFPELFSVPVLEGPTKSTEGSSLTLSCLSTPSPLRPRAPLLHVFYQDGQVVGGPQGSPQLLVPAVGVSHSGNYSCEVHSEGGSVRKSSARLSVSVRSVPPSGVSLSVQPPRGQVALGDRLVLNCTVATGTGPLSFSWHREGSAAPLGTGPQLELPHVGDNDSGQYQCRVSDGDSVSESDPLNVTVLVPVANATITPGPPAHRVRAGDAVTLHCSVQVGSAPVTFTWLHNGQEVAQGPLLEFGDVDVGHWGTYQCVATNQLGQDGHRVFRALSPELALEVTLWGHKDTVAAGVGGALLFLVLLVGVIVAWHRWHRVASPHATTLQDPQVTYAELRGPHGRPQGPGDIYGNVL